MHSYFSLFEHVMTSLGIFERRGCISKISLSITMYESRFFHFIRLGILAHEAMNIVRSELTLPHRAEMTRVPTIYTKMCGNFMKQAVLSIKE